MEDVPQSLKIFVLMSESSLLYSTCSLREELAALPTQSTNLELRNTVTQMLTTSVGTHTISWSALPIFMSIISLSRFNYFL